MVATAKAREVYVPWEYQGEKGGLRISLGTLEFLGIGGDDISITEIEFSVGTRQITRDLYPGGPALTYTRPGQIIKRMIGGRVSTAKGGSPMFLEVSDGTTDTIRVTGSKRAFARWLKSKVNIDGINETIVLKNYNKTTYSVLREKPGI